MIEPLTCLAVKSLAKGVRILSNNFSCVVDTPFSTFPNIRHTSRTNNVHPLVCN